MRVFGWASDPQEEWTAPYPRGWIGFKLRKLGGSLVSPDIASGEYRSGRSGEPKNWFNTVPTLVTVGYLPTPRKWFFSVGIWKFGFYIGHKVFGVDSPAYRDYPGICNTDVYIGSQAMTGFTARFTTNRAMR